MRKQRKAKMQVSLLNLSSFISPKRCDINQKWETQTKVKITESKKVDLAGTCPEQHPAGVTQLSYETPLPVLKTMWGELVF